MKKTTFSILKYSVILLLLILVTSHLQAQNKPIDNETVHSWAKNKQFIFTAQSATPLGGNLIQLNYVYYLQMKSDSIVSYLPYYGRAYTAPISTEDAGLSFTCGKFTYEITKADDSKTEITIETKDQRNNYKLFFTLFDNGDAQLQVTSNNRQAIRFDGYVAEKSMK